MLLARPVAVLGWLDTVYVPKTFGRDTNASECATVTKEAAKGPNGDQE